MNTNYNYIFTLMIKHTTSKEEIKQILDDWNWWTFQNLIEEENNLLASDEPLTLTTVYEEK